MLLLVKPLTTINCNTSAKNKDRVTEANSLFPYLDNSAHDSCQIITVVYDSRAGLQKDFFLSGIRIFT